MKFYRSIYINEREFPPELYRIVTHLAPAFRKGDHFHLECQPGDERSVPLANQIVALCEGYGVKRSPGGDNGTYGYRITRHYETKEILTAELLLVGGQRKMIQDATERDQAGRLLVPAVEAKPTVKIASIFPTHWIVVSDAVRKTLEQGKLVGLTFVKGVIKGRSIHTSEPPLWELASSLMMPKMVNSVLIESDHRGICRIDDPPYTYGEPHYRRSELQRRGALDIARTLELYAQPRPALVVSQRFYQHCVKNKIPLQVSPVRVDPD